MYLILPIKVIPKFSVLKIHPSSTTLLLKSTIFNISRDTVDRLIYDDCCTSDFLLHCHADFHRASIMYLFVKKKNVSVPLHQQTIKKLKNQIPPFPHSSILPKQIQPRNKKKARSPSDSREKKSKSSPSARSQAQQRLPRRRRRSIDSRRARPPPDPPRELYSCCARSLARSPRVQRPRARALSRH